MLDFGYQLPDCIWAQPAHLRSPRNTHDFAVLADRCFIRGLLPVKLEDGEEFRYGVWLEVDAAAFRRARKVWNDPARYPALTFAATIANAAPPWAEQILGARVDVGVREPSARPFVRAARDAWLQDLLERGWTGAEYEEVVARLFPD